MESMRRLERVLTVSLLVLVTTHGDAALARQDPPIKPAAVDSFKVVDLGPGGYPPQIGHVRGISKDGKSLELEVRRTIGIYQKKLVDRDEEVEQDGRSVTKTIREERTVVIPRGYQPRVVAYPLDQVRVYDLEGHRIPASKVAGLFYKSRMILWGFEGEKVDPEYLLVAREETPFVILPNLVPLTAPAPALRRR